MTNGYEYEGYMSNYDKVVKKFKDAYDMPCSVGKHVSESFIFDEDKSVKWNREEVVRHNQQIRENNQRYREDRYNALKEAEAAIIDYLQAEFSDVSISIIKEFYKYIYEREYYDNYDIEQVIDVCEEILEIFSKKYD